METHIFENTEVAFASKDDRALREAELLFKLMGNNSLVNWGSKVANFALKLRLPVTPLFRITVYEQFCGGETFDECKNTIQQLSKYGVAAMLNYGVEFKETEDDFERTVSHILEAISFAGKNKSANIICIKPTSLGRLNLFTKIQSGTDLSKQEAQEAQHIKERFKRLSEAALNSKIQIYIDAEETWYQDTIDRIVEELMTQYNKEYAVVCNTVQLYRTDRLAYLEKEIAKAKAQNYFYGIKLVRGAYMEKENLRAAENAYVSPIHKSKKASDKDFNAAINLCLENIENTVCCIATQSEESCYYAMKIMEQKSITPNHPNVCFSQLYGMGDNISFNLANLGYNAYKYLPYGPVKDVIPYLIRRAQENTSVNGQMSRQLKLIQQEIERRK